MIEMRDVGEKFSALLPAGKKELMEYLRFLTYKYRGKHLADVIKLEGIWADVDFDIN